MKAELLSKEDLDEKILLKDFGVELTNAIRRAIIRTVPTYAIEDVTIYKNTSSMYNEVLAQRLGLIPLKVTSDKKEFTFKLSVKGPKTVYSGDIQFEDGVKPVYDKMIIVRLKDREEINLEGNIIQSTGEDHAKFIPAYVSYRFKAKINIVKQPDDPKKVAEVCPVKVFDVKNNKLEVVNPDACTLCLACVDVAGEDKIKVEGDENNIIFEIETYGSLSNKEIIDKAIDNLSNELKALKEKLGSK